MPVTSTSENEGRGEDLPEQVKGCLQISELQKGIIFKNTKYIQLNQSFGQS